MSTIHLIGGEKGGVGKSVVSRLYAQYHIDTGKPFMTLDSDLSHGALRRFYADFSKEVNLNEFESADQIMEAALESENVIVDLAAQTATPLDAWIKENDFLELAKECGVRVVFWHVMEDSLDSLVLLQELFDRYGKGPEYVVVKNYVRGGEFSQFDASSVLGAAEKMNAKIIAIKELHKPTMRKIDQLSASFWSAVNNKSGDSGHLSLMERQRVKVWLRSAYKAFDNLEKAAAA